MKLKTYLLIILALSFLACANKETKKQLTELKIELTQQDIVRKNAEDYVKPKMNDPDSYEFAELLITDSVMYSDNIKNSKEWYQGILDFEKDQLAYEKRMKIHKSKYPSIYSEEKVAKYKANIMKYDNILAEIDSIELKLGEKVNEVASYRYIFTFRENNEFRARVIKEYIIQTKPSPGFEVLTLTDDEDQLLVSPNSFPGYIEMMEKYK